MPPARKGPKPGDGTCGVCSQTDVLTSVCEKTGTEYCRGVYNCRKGAGVNVKGTGTGAKKRKRRCSNADGGTAGGDGSAGGSQPFPVLWRPDQIIGHRLFNMEPLPFLDSRRGEPLLRCNYNYEFYVRGIYKRSDSDPGVCDTFWRPQHELMEYAKLDDEAWERVVHLINQYTDETKRALGVGSCEGSPQYSEEAEEAEEVEEAEEADEVKSDGDSE